MVSLPRVRFGAAAPWSPPLGTSLVSLVCGDDGAPVAYALPGGGQRVEVLVWPTDSAGAVDGPAVRRSGPARGTWDLGPAELGRLTHLHRRWPLVRHDLLVTARRDGMVEIAPTAWTLRDVITGA